MRTRPFSGAIACACAIAALGAAPASANIIPAATRSLPIKVPSLGGSSVGTATMTVTYTDTQATATALAPTVSLGKGQVMQVEVCVKAHVRGLMPDTQCAQKTVDTRGLTSVLNVAAPTVTAKLNRPASGGSAYFSYDLSITQKQADGSFKEVASSWPSAGLTAASAAVPVLGASSAPAPVSEGAALSTGGNGGIDSGLPDSMCAPVSGATPDAPGAGVSTSGLGSDAPAYYEVGEPSGAFEGAAPKGVMVLIHGGGWYYTGAAGVAAMRSSADRWRQRGWRTLNVTYRPCATSFTDVKWFYDRARQLWGDTLPYCAEGESAGGNLALMLSAARSSLACVVDESGPTDGVSLKDQKTDATNANAAVNGPHWVYNMLVAAVGTENVVWWSPALFKLNARVLYAQSAADPYMPYAQGTELRDKMLAANPSAYVDLHKLDGGSAPFVHANVSPDALASFYSAEEALVAPLTGASG